MTQTCYRHPDRETAVSCSSCGRPICPDCMTPTPVGMRCPECMRQQTKVIRNPTGTPGQFSAFPATMVLIAINIVVYLIEIAHGGGGIGEQSTRTLYDLGGLFGPSVAEGDWWRLLTSGFVHVSPLHIGFNMFLLYFLGRLLEPALGTPRFVAVYFASLLAGSFGVMLLDPNVVSAGASGAIFGLAGATFVIARGRGMDAIAGEIGFLIVFNLVFTFAAANISVGAHLGGLVGGVICALTIVAGERGMFGARRLPVELLLIAAVGAVSFFGALAVA
ncbi:MAG: rhomboid family intramembrane serine protease [Solirubrobacterales bacterium]|nr:rhomboid family intramembrane serine protease [Solirubrobacterales bacterium]